MHADVIFNMDYNKLSLMVIRTVMLRF